MNRYGYFRVAAAVPRVDVANCPANAAAVADCVLKAASEGARLVVLPEMAVTAYTCGDLFQQRALLDGAVEALIAIADATADTPIVAVVGAPLHLDGRLYNCAVAIAEGVPVAVVPKTYLPNYGEFYEKRWWQPADPDMAATIDFGRWRDIPFGTDLLLRIDGVNVGIEICEDLWVPVPPSCIASLRGADVVVNLSASDDLIGKFNYLRTLVLQQSARCIAGYVYASAGFGESSTDLVFDGKGMIAENGVMLAELMRWDDEVNRVVAADIDIEALRHDRQHSNSFGDNAANITSRFADSRLVEVNIAHLPANRQLMRYVNPMPFVPTAESTRNERCREIINIQVAGLARRLAATHTKSLVVGISGGLDSTLALLVACRTFKRLGLDPKGIVGVTMPGFGTTGRTYNNALQLMRCLGVTIREIPIADAVNIHFRDIGHDPAVTDVTYENSQARERTQILMDVANQVGGMVLGTGDMSELALGWATYNGDHMSMYGVNAGVPKTLVRHLVRWFADNTDSTTERDTLRDIIDTPISPELTPAASDGTIAQRTEDLVGPYELHDFFLYNTLRYGFAPDKILYLAREAFPERDAEEIKHWLRTFVRRFFSQQFKRSCLPDGPKVGSVCLSPRGDWRMPSDASAALWLASLD